MTLVISSVTVDVEQVEVSSADQSESPTVTAAANRAERRDDQYPDQYLCHLLKAGW